MTHVSALSDQFLLLTLNIKIKGITIDQFTGIWYICFGNVKQNRVTSLSLLPESEKGIGNSLDYYPTVRVPHTGGGDIWQRRATLQKCEEALGTRLRSLVAPASAPHLAPSLTPHCTLFAGSFKLTSEVQPDGRRLASSIIASIIREWFLVCYLHCSLGEKTSLPIEVLQFLLFIQDYTSNPIIKHRSCPESGVIAYRCAQTKTSAHPTWPLARCSIHSGLMIEMAN